MLKLEPLASIASYMILIQLADTLEYIAGHLFNLTDLLPYIFIINNMSYPNTIGIYSICIQEMITPAILFTTHTDDPLLTKILSAELNTFSLMA